MLLSTSHKGDCWENAVASRFYALLKYEIFAGSVFPSDPDADAALTDVIKHWYSPKRRYSTLRNVCPLEYEQQLRQPSAEG